MGQAYETDERTILCACGETDLQNAPHDIWGHGRGRTMLQVEGRPQSGRETHTRTHCYFEVCYGHEWFDAVAAWKANLDARRSHNGIGFAPINPLPVNNGVFAALPDDPTLTARDAAERGSDPPWLSPRKASA